MTQELLTPMTRQMTGTLRQQLVSSGSVTDAPTGATVADPSAVPISGLHEVTVAMIGTTQQPPDDKKWVSLMIDSGAATHVCPLWFASQFPLHQLAHGTGPQLRTVTSQHIKLHGCRWVCMTNHSGQQVFIPFYVCEDKHQFFRLQGWWNKVSNLHRVTIQDYSTSKASTALWRTEMACSSYKQKSQHCQKEPSYRYTTQNKNRLP